MSTELKKMTPYLVSSMKIWKIFPQGPCSERLGDVLKGFESALDSTISFWIRAKMQTRSRRNRTRYNGMIRRTILSLGLNWLLWFVVTLALVVDALDGPSNRMCGCDVTSSSDWWYLRWNLAWKQVIAISRYYEWQKENISWICTYPPVAVYSRTILDKHTIAIDSVFSSKIDTTFCRSFSKFKHSVLVACTSYVIGGASDGRTGSHLGFLVANLRLPGSVHIFAAFHVIFEIKNWLINLLSILWQDEGIPNQTMWRRYDLRHCQKKRGTRRSTNDTSGEAVITNWYNRLKSIGIR
jgi:hypothetical protein